jgi:putative PIN family toxin of toxin-antitoxin system
MRIVLDANVLVSALISAKGTPARLLAYWQAGEFDVVVSPSLLQELERVLEYPRLRQRYPLPDDKVQRFLGLLRTYALEVDPTDEITIIQRDPADNRYLECALAGEAQYIVSGDSHLLELREYQGVRILAPAEFLILLKLGGGV